jgi:hypothetical protein
MSDRSEDAAVPDPGWSDRAANLLVAAALIVIALSMATILAVPWT